MYDIKRKTIARQIVTPTIAGGLGILKISGGEPDGYHTGT
jgi:hypothetical protein